MPRRIVGRKSAFTERKEPGKRPVFTNMENSEKSTILAFLKNEQEFLESVFPDIRDSQKYRIKTRVSRIGEFMKEVHKMGSEIPSLKAHETPVQITGSTTLIPEFRKNVDPDAQREHAITTATRTVRTKRTNNDELK